ncbi:hypothetical protein VHEMI03632 [[Torrubiella] hemipterigena]|uniref:Histone H4 n=1 Tax=[Torrubiella] hemipterigena TaxID=1531966 RepID=A0A0A1SZ52_9HYPO|nr:hypothetical protein VHEMI03632 [[Torrubiella] hemipterigena]
MPDMSRVPRGGPHRASQTVTPGPNSQLRRRASSTPFLAFNKKGTARKSPHVRRNRKILKDNILGVTCPVIRRMARRGGVKRISAGIYDEVRTALRDRLSKLLSLCVIYAAHADRKTIMVDDVLLSLKRVGQTLYGFDPDGLRNEPRLKRRVGQVAGQLRLG